MKKTKNVKMNLTLSQEFYQLLKKNASDDFMKVATWTKQFLMKNLVERHNEEEKCVTQNGTDMEL